MTRKYLSMESPLGLLYIAATEKGLSSVSWSEPVDGEKYGLSDSDAVAEILHRAAGELKDYFAGNLTRFTVPLDLVGTEFQKSVWASLLSIPYGETVSYRDIAVKLGNPRAIRAVGTANGRNPVPIIVPCHRVINANGQLGGYSGGLDKKTLMLQLEKCLLV